MSEGEKLKAFRHYYYEKENKPVENLDEFCATVLEGRISKATFSRMVNNPSYAVSNEIKSIVEKAAGVSFEDFEYDYKLKISRKKKREDVLERRK